MSNRICGTERNSRAGQPQGELEQRLEPRRAHRIGRLEQRQGDHGAEEALDHALEELGKTDHRLARPDQPHDLRLGAADVEHEGGGGGHGEDGGQREHRSHGETHHLEEPLPAGEAFHPLRAALHFLRLGQRGELRGERPRRLGGGRALGGRHLERGGERIARQVIDHVSLGSERLSQGAQSLRLPDIAHPLHALQVLHATGEIGEGVRRRLVLEKTTTFTRSRHCPTARPRFNDRSQNPPSAVSDSVMSRMALMPTRPARRRSTKASLTMKLSMEGDFALRLILRP
jgi:hypothetical protein